MNTSSSSATKPGTVKSRLSSAGLNHTRMSASIGAARAASAGFSPPRAAMFEAALHGVAAAHHVHDAEVGVCVEVLDPLAARFYNPRMLRRPDRVRLLHAERDALAAQRQNRAPAVNPSSNRPGTRRHLRP